MELEVYQVDSFTTELFKGNPAGVCITENSLSESLMTLVTQEIAVSETAFLSLSDMTLRWFTPMAEVNLCGHGTLATVHILKEKEIIKTGDRVNFMTLSGTLTALINETTIELDFPSPDIKLNVTPHLMLINNLGLDISNVLSFGLFDNTKVILEVDCEKTLQNLQPNFEAMKKTDGRAVLVTTRSETKKLDFVSRYFAPWVGVNEDPVTGSAHCALAVYWSKKLNKLKLHGYQASERGGYIAMELLSNGRTKLIGSAVTAIKGIMQVPDLN